MMRVFEVRMYENILFAKAKKGASNLLCGILPLNNAADGLDYIKGFGILFCFSDP